MLTNTSFNVRGEPIVCTPEDAYRYFMRTEMDYLVIVFYLVVTPMGVMMCLFDYDPMAMKRKAENGSYRKTADKHTSEHFERPF